MIITHTKITSLTNFQNFSQQYSPNQPSSTSHATPEKAHLRTSASDHPVNISSVEISAYKHKNKF
jgi:hypothetical protein